MQEIKIALKPEKIERSRPFSLLEEQKASIKQQIKSVPVIFIYRDRSLIGRWDGGISLKIDTPVEEIQAVINDRSRYRRVTTN